MICISQPTGSTREPNVRQPMRQLTGVPAQRSRGNFTKSTIHISQQTDPIGEPDVWQPIRQPSRAPGQKPRGNFAKSMIRISQSTALAQSQRYGNQSDSCPEHWCRNPGTISLSPRSTSHNPQCRQRARHVATNQIAVQNPGTKFLENFTKSTICISQSTDPIRKPDAR